MKTLLLLLIVLSAKAHAVDGLTIPNSFMVDQEGQVYRGKEPKSQVDELSHIGITDVIIYKNDTKGEVAKEIIQLKKLGIQSYHIPFRWKEFPSMIEACEQTVEALNTIHTVKKKGGRVFFHCSLGEDRTGMLAGLYRMLEERISEREAFRTEMCERGYSDGNPTKPGMVTGAIQKELTPLFIALSAKIQRGEWKPGKISKKSCQGLVIQPTSLKCR